MPLADTRLSKTASELEAEAPNPPQPLNGLKQPHPGTGRGWSCLNSLCLTSLLREAGKGNFRAFLSGNVILEGPISPVKQSGKNF